MAKNPTLAAACAALDADGIAALLDAGSLQLYDGAQPASPDVAVSTQVLLAELTYGSPAFGTAVGGTATANAVTADTNAPASGQASWTRHVTAAGVGVMDGTVGVGTDTEHFDLEVDTVGIAAGSTVAVSVVTITV